MKLPTMAEKTAEMLRVRRLAEHHTTGDWDFSDMLWNLDVGVFVSPPSSLHYSLQPDSTLEAKIKIAVVPIANVKEGRFDAYYRVSSNASTWLHFITLFRWQDANNYYYTRIWSVDGRVQIYRVKLGVTVQLATMNDGKWPVNTWKRFRVTWWNDYVGIAIRVEKFTDPTWTHLLDGYDAENNWKNIGGRVGLRMRVGYLHHVYTDDCVIYGVT